MEFVETTLFGAWLIDPVPTEDSRGFFARTFCVDEFAKHGLETSFVQHSMSYSVKRGTLRGMHYQRHPHCEVKLVSCRKGAVWDVIVDIRPESPTFRRWQAFELTAECRRHLYVPAGFAHGFQTLSDDVEVSYLISTPYQSGSAAGIRYNDPAFGIVWPLAVTEISEKDLQWPDFAQ